MTPVGFLAFALCITEPVCAVPWVGQSVEGYSSEMSLTEENKPRWCYNAPFTGAFALAGDELVFRVEGYYPLE